MLFVGCAQKRWVADGYGRLTIHNHTHLLWEQLLEEGTAGKDSIWIEKDINWSGHNKSPLQPKSPDHPDEKPCDFQCYAQCLRRLEHGESAFAYPRRIQRCVTLCHCLAEAGQGFLPPDPSIKSSFGGVLAD